VHVIMNHVNRVDPADPVGGHNKLN